MIIRNKKNGTNILNFANTRVIIKAFETINIPDLIHFSQIVNKADFGKRGWFEIVQEEKKETENLKVKELNEETSLDRAKKEVKEYASNKIKE